MVVDNPLRRPYFRGGIGKIPKNPMIRLPSWELTYPIPVGPFESMIFPTSRLVGYVISLVGTEV